MGDYIGKAGLERTYEKSADGTKGIGVKRDKKPAHREASKTAAADTAAVAGQNMHTSLRYRPADAGRKLMENKLGSIVAVDPRTGGVLHGEQSHFKPKLLTGRKKNTLQKFYWILQHRCSIVLYRPTYSPGSTF